MEVVGNARLGGAESGDFDMALDCVGDVVVTGGEVEGTLDMDMKVAGEMYFDSYPYRNFGMRVDVSGDVDIYDSRGRMKWVADPDLPPETL